MYIDCCSLTFSRERVCVPKDENNQNNDVERPTGSNLYSPPGSEATGTGNANAQNGPSNPNCTTRSLLKSASISGSKSYEQQSKDPEVANSILSNA